MKTKQIKTNLINAISQTDNPILLMEISKLIDIDLDDNKVVKLNKKQISEIKIAINEIEHGEYLTHAAAKKAMNKWLND
jgi:hypothetical protein